MQRYKNTGLSIDDRVNDLLSSMTLREKIGQLNQRMKGWYAYRKTNGFYEITDDFKDEVAFGDGLGAIYGLFRADSWSAVTFENGVCSKDSAHVANMLQRYVIENTRLGIPMLLTEECPHGHQALDGTMLPTNIGIGSTWNPELYKKALSLVAAEIRAGGANLGLLSCLDMLRDPRWGRSEECFGEDPYLSSRMTAAAVEGLQGNSPEDLSRPDKIAVVVKHFCAQGAAVGGHNGKTVNIGERELREIHLPTMKAAVSAGAAACMAAYNEIDGVYCSGSRWLLTDVLRGELGFRGFVMSDAGAVDELQKITGSLELAVAKAVKAGVDMNLMNDSYSLLEKDVEDGKIKEEDIDEAVRRILRIKFLLGLFEQPYVKEEDSERKAGREELRRISRQLAQESIVLLKNRNAALPLRGDLQKIVVIGPNADALYNQLGDYTPPQRDGTGTTILDGIRGRVSSGTEVLYARGCGIRDSSTDGIADAVSKTKASQAAIVVVGGSSTRDFDLKFDTNGAAIVGENPSEMDCGEGMDVAELELGGAQLELVKKIVATGTPTVVVLIEGRPHSIPWIAENCDAVLCAWYPGPEGGSAVADVLFGILNPCGRLPVSVPRSSGQLPVFYNYKETDDYLDMKASPQYPFGFGLSYTEFKYGTPSLSTGTVSLAELDDGRAVEVQVSVKNVGRVAGSEVAQLYIRDMEASVSPRNRVLIGFEKIWLEPGEIKTVTFSIGKNELSIWNEEMYFVPEIGNVDIFVGSDSTAAMYTILRITS